MCLLGRKYCSSAAEASVIPEGDFLKSNLTSLLAGEPGLDGRRKQLTTSLKGNADGISGGPGSASGIMHAARGGWKTFELACQQIMRDDEMVDGLPLLVVLGLCIELSPDKFDNRCKQPLAQLLAQAALGGDVLVLKEIYSVARGGLDTSSARNQSVLRRCEVFHAKEACHSEKGW